MWLTSQPYLLRTTGDGQRLISWRMWVLVWVLPACFGLATLWFALEAAYKRLATVPGEGEVVRVYAWEGETPFDRGVTNYSPVFRYVWSDGAETEASTGMSHPNWNFPVGSRHAIRFFPGQKADVVLPGPHNRALAAILGLITAVCLVPSLLAARALLRWRGRGAQA